MPPRLGTAWPHDRRPLEDRWPMPAPPLRTRAPIAPRSSDGAARALVRRSTSGLASEGDRALPATRAATRPDDQHGSISPGTAHVEEQLGGGRVGESDPDRVRPEVAPFAGPPRVHPVQLWNRFATKSGGGQVTGVELTVGAQRQPGLVRAGPDSGQAAVVDRVDPGPHLSAGAADPPRECQCQRDQDAKHPPQSRRPPSRNWSRHRGARSRPISPSSTARPINPAPRRPTLTVVHDRSLRGWAVEDRMSARPVTSAQRR